LALFWLSAAVFNGSVFQWIEFQIPILKMQVRFLPGSLEQNQKKSKPLNSYGLAVFVFMAHPKYSPLVIVVVRDSVRVKLK
jgi:hypothetical protein